MGIDRENEVYIHRGIPNLQLKPIFDQMKTAGNHLSEL